MEKEEKTLLNKLSELETFIDDNLHISFVNRYKWCNFIREELINKFCAIIEENKPKPIEKPPE